ncbi:MAG: trehalose-phosphatase [Acidobacteriia bacterium]|nr:trehalose-phosphatase [Terriglobia bacterium]
MQALTEVEERIRSARQIFLYLDFDGTLAPMVADPAAARLCPEARETLRRLAGRGSWTVTIVSGRAVGDLYARIGLDGLIYAGNHGLEISGPNLHFVEPEAAARREPLHRLALELAVRLRPLAGVLVEYKRLTVSVHYRRAAAADIAKAEAAVREAVAAGGEFRLMPGVQVFEIVPRANWHKGAAVEWINRRLGNGDALAIYLGDDASDEDAFAVLPDGITVKVGSAATAHARYHLSGPGEVDEFLSWLEQAG